MNALIEVTFKPEDGPTFCEDECTYQCGSTCKDGILGEVATVLDVTDKLAYIADYDMWFVIERMMKEGVVSPGLIGEAIEEYKKFMGLIARGYRGMGMCSAIVDEVWHTHILFTMEYHEFCNAIVGKYIHHAPRTSRSLPGEATTDFFAAYQEVYGEEAPPIWRVKMDDQPLCKVCEDPS